MELLELTPQDYRLAFPRPAYAYASVDFAMLNAYKVDAVHCLGLSDGRHMRLGIILGERDGSLSCPFSAPFGAVDCRGVQHLPAIETLFDALDEFRAGRPLHLTLPPAIFAPALQPKLAFEAARRCSARYDDINYHFPTERLADYGAVLDTESRRKLRKGLEAGFIPRWSTDPDLAYETIRLNRLERGFPLRMTLEQVRATVRLIPCHCLTLTAPDGAVAASAIIFLPAHGIAQVIYWGSLERYNHLRPMNVLAREVFSRMRAEGIALVDVGPSSSDGQPNTGLCEFKESVGCLPSIKPSFTFG